MFKQLLHLVEDAGDLLGGATSLVLKVLVGVILPANHLIAPVTHKSIYPINVDASMVEEVPETINYGICCPSYRYNLVNELDSSTPEVTNNRTVLLLGSE